MENTLDYKLEVAQSLREGLRELRKVYRRKFYQSTQFPEQWQYLVMKESLDIDWAEHKSTIDRNFAWKSQRLLKRIRG